MTITHEKLLEIFDTHESVKTGSWRWGKTETYIFKEGDKHYSVTARFHHSEGLQDEGKVEAHEVRPVEKTVIDWVRVDNNPPKTPIARPAQQTL